MSRRTLPVLIAVVLTALTVAAPSASASSVDPEVVAEAIAEDGYYIDSSANYLTGDDAQDRLRYQLERARTPVFVAVVPAGTSLTPAQVYGLAKRRGTYAVLNGGALHAVSNTLTGARVNGAVNQAVQAHPGDPAGAIIAFVGLTNGTRPVGTGPKQPRHTATPLALVDTEEPTPEASSAAPVTATPAKNGGGAGPLLIGGLAVLVIAVAGAGYLLWRKSHGKSNRIAA